MRFERKKPGALFGAVTGFLLMGISAYASQDFPKGRTIDRVICAKDSRFSYALYLPSAYAADRKWPVIVCFDPRADGRRPVELLRGAAESSGFIVAGSLDSKNGPLEPSQQAAKAVWADIRERLTIDPERVYAAGFSGGAEVAVLFPYFVETRVAGILSCGAGLPPRHEPEWVKPAVYCGIIGRLDFRYQDMARLEDPFTEAGVIHRFIYFDGWHQWPSAALLGDAVDWLELIAMKNGLKAKDSAFIEAEYKKRRAGAQVLDEDGRLIQCVHELESIIADFAGLLEISGAEEKILEVKSRPEYQTMAEKKRSAQETETVLQPRTLEVFANFDQLISGQATVRLKDLERALGIDALLSDSSREEDVFRSEMAKRILSQVAILADQRGFRFRASGQFPLAVLCFELAVKSSPGHPMNPGEYYNLAAALALWGKKKDALKNLRLAVEKGFDDIGFLENDRDLDTLRGTQEYKALLDGLKSRAEKVRPSASESGPDDAAI